MYRKKPQEWLKHLDFILLDLLCLNISLQLAYAMRHSWENMYDKRIYLNMAIVMSLLSLIVSVFYQTFKNVLKRGYYKEFSITVKHVIMVTVLCQCYIFATRMTAAYSRIVLGMGMVVYIFLAYITRIIWKKLLTKRFHELSMDAVLLITYGECARSLIQYFQNESYTSYCIKGVILLDQENPGQKDICGVPVVAGKADALDYICYHWVDEVLISLPAGKIYPAEFISQLMEMGVVVHYQLVELLHTEGAKQMIERMGKYTVLTSSINTATPLQMFLKRTMDIMGGMVGCVITLVLSIILGPAIYISSPGPIFFSQLRVGKNGKVFKIYKFRSMYLDAEEKKKEMFEENELEDDYMFKVKYDRRIIGCKIQEDGTVKKGLGNYMRDLSLDEFPQFFNVLKGDMSLVGTRPPTIDEWKKYQLHHRARLAVKPGITGLWQVSGRSSITSFEQVVELDKKYIMEWSMALDLRILLKTVKVVLKRDGAM